MQKIFSGYDSVREVLREIGAERHMLVCDSSFRHLPIGEGLDQAVTFDQFSPNPLYEQVCKGVEMFNNNGCDAIVAVGGGSTIDVAKCIKLYCRMDAARNYLEQECKDSGVPLIAVPTTAGTGSESTRYAVIYYEGKKQSVTHESIIPDYAVLEPLFLKTLPAYQKKCTMLDALCQGIESMWSLHSTGQSMEFSKTAIQKILGHWQGYMSSDMETDAKEIMLAANFAGRAINITQTTAPHAMSYKLTSMYGIPHGHAVALCLPEVWQYMLEHSENCTDPRGVAHLTSVFEALARIMGCDSPEKAVMLFREILSELDLPRPKCSNSDEELELLASSVNPVRLKNNPVSISGEIIRHLYETILR